MSKSVGDVEMLLETWLTDLDIKDEGNNIKVRTKRRLGTELFKEIMAKVKSVGGTYVSAGKDSHFWIPKKVESAIVTGVMYCPHCGKGIKLEKA